MRPLTRVRLRVAVVIAVLLSGTICLVVSNAIAGWTRWLDTGFGRTKSGLTASGDPEAMSALKSAFALMPDSRRTGVDIFQLGGVMQETQTLTPAQELAATNKVHYPNESARYRAARNQLLAEEIELRRHVERVASQRRALPPGGEIPQDFEFISEAGPVRLSSLFGDHPTLVIYSIMYGPQRNAPCPMCTSFLTSWNGTAVNLRQRVALAVTARSSIERLVEYKKQRGFTNLPFVSDLSGEYTRNYVNPEDADVPGFSVFHRDSGVIRHFYSGEMSGAMADPGQDPRGGPDLDSLWLMLDLTPEGRGTDWYPKLDYGQK